MYSALVSVSFLCGFLLPNVRAFQHVRATDDAKIVGGERAPDEYPYQISLQVKLPYYLAFMQASSPDGWTHNCGGSVVTARHIVTAAHCLKGYEPTGLSIWAGTTKLNRDGQRFMVAGFIIHPDYVVLNMSDIGIITIRGAFVLGQKISPIGYSADQIGGGVNCVLTGWGFTTPIRMGNAPNDLQRIKQTTITNEQCADDGQEVDKTGICTKPIFGKGACGGDSGGPLAMGNKLIGVVSYGTRVCGIGSPDVYTRVSLFYQWIKDNTV